MFLIHVLKTYSPIDEENNFYFLLSVRETFQPALKLNNLLCLQNFNDVLFI